MNRFPYFRANNGNWGSSWDNGWNDAPPNGAHFTQYSRFENQQFENQRFNQRFAAPQFGSPAFQNNQFPRGPVYGPRRKFSNDKSINLAEKRSNSKVPSKSSPKAMGMKTKGCLLLMCLLFDLKSEVLARSEQEVEVTGDHTTGSSGLANESGVSTNVTSSKNKNKSVFLAQLDGS